MGSDFLYFALQYRDYSDIKEICRNYDSTLVSTVDVHSLALGIASCRNARAFVTILRTSAIFVGRPTLSLLLVANLLRSGSSEPYLLPLVFYYLPASVWGEACKEDSTKWNAPSTWNGVRDLLHNYWPRLFSAATSVPSSLPPHIDPIFKPEYMILRFRRFLLCVRLVNVAMAFFPLHLPPYVLLQIIEELPGFASKTKFGHKQRIERIVRICEWKRIDAETKKRQSEAERSERQNEAVA